jgi:RnfABCDGE-type electron transport complex B subunit
MTIWIYMLLAAAIMVVLAAVMALVLGRASRAWRVEEDPLVVQIEEALAGLDCGGCGHPTCREYAEGIAAGEDIHKCRPGGRQTLHAVAEIMDVEIPKVGSRFAVVHCGARAEDRLRTYGYEGEQTCAAADLVSSVQGCVYGCLGLGDCERACPFDAIHVIDGLAQVDFRKCTACGKCVAACPRDIITIKQFKADKMIVVACCNEDPGKVVRGVCKVGCIACGICARTSDLFSVDKYLSRIDYERYDANEHAEGLTTASEKCPTGCLPFRGRPEGQAPPESE